MSTTDPVYARAIARRVEIRMELREIDTFLTVYRRMTNTTGPGAPRGGGSPEATPEGSVSSPAGETAAIDPADYEKLLACWRSGQIEPSEWLYLLDTDHAMREWFLGLTSTVPGEQSAAPCAPTEPHPETGNRGGDDVDQHEGASPMTWPVREESPPATAEPAKVEYRGGQQNFSSGLSKEEKCERLMPVLREAAEVDGRVPLSNSQMAVRTGIPEGSIYGTLSELRKRGLIRRNPGGPAYVVGQGIKPENTESREDEAAPTAVPEAEPQQAPARETAATDSPGERRERTSRTTGECPEAPPTGDEGGNAPAGTAAPIPADLPRSAAFDSTAPKPEWDFGKDRLVVQAPRMAAGVPDRLSVAGSYLICGDQNIRLSKEQATIVARLVKDWGSAVRREDLAEEIMSRSTTGMTARAALEHTKLKPLGEINALIKEAGLMVLEDAGRWKLTQRQEAGQVTA